MKGSFVFGELTVNKSEFGGHNIGDANINKENALNFTRSAWNIREMPIKRFYIPQPGIEPGPQPIAGRALYH